MPNGNRVQFNGQRHVVRVPIAEFKSEDRPGILVDVVRNGELNWARVKSLGLPFIDQNAVIGHTRHG